MSLPLILWPGEGRSVRIGTKTACTFKVTGHDTHGRFGLFEYNMAPGTEGPRPHIHKKLVEMFYVVDGERELLLVVGVWPTIGAVIKMLGRQARGEKPPISGDSGLSVPLKI